MRHVGVPCWHGWVHWWHVVVVIVVVVIVVVVIVVMVIVVMVIVVMVIVMVVIVMVVIRMVVHDVAVEVSEANWAAFGWSVLVVKDSAAEANVIANGAIIVMVMIVVMIVVMVLVVIVDHLPHHVAELHFFFAGNTPV